MFFQENLYFLRRDIYCHEQETCLSLDGNPGVPPGRPLRSPPTARKAPHATPAPTPEKARSRRRHRRCAGRRRNLHGRDPHQRHRRHRGRRARPLPVLDQRSRRDRAVRRAGGRVRDHQRHGDRPDPLLRSPAVGGVRPSGGHARRGRPVRRVHPLRAGERRCRSATAFPTPPTARAATRADRPAGQRHRCQDAACHLQVQLVLRRLPVQQQPGRHQPAPLLRRGPDDVRLDVPDRARRSACRSPRPRVDPRSRSTWPTSRGARADRPAGGRARRRGRLRRRPDRRDRLDRGHPGGRQRGPGAGQDRLHPAGQLHALRPRDRRRRDRRGRRPLVHRASAAATRATGPARPASTASTSPRAARARTSRSRTSPSSATSPSGSTTTRSTASAAPCQQLDRRRPVDPAHQGRRLDGRPDGQLHHQEQPHPGHDAPTA